MIKKILFLIFVFSYSITALALPETTSFTQQKIFTHWVENRCIGKITSDKNLISDANASAAAWLEVSKLPVEIYQQADAAIDKGLEEPLTGATNSTYNILKCTLIASSDDVQKIFVRNKK